MAELSGQSAEKLVAEYLIMLGFKIVAQNWKTRVYEIDIIAERHQAVHFIEVKYRQSAARGEALEYITPRKARQLRFAAELWVAENAWEGDYQIDVAGITGELRLKNLQLILNAV